MNLEFIYQGETILLIEDLDIKDPDTVKLLKDGTEANVSKNHTDDLYSFQLPEKGSYEILYAEKNKLRRQRFYAGDIQSIAETSPSPAPGQSGNDFLAGFDQVKTDLSAMANHAPKALADALSKNTYNVKLVPSSGAETPDKALWDLIRKSDTRFQDYRRYMDAMFASGFDGIAAKGSEASYNDAKRLPFHRTDSYSFLKYATERFVERNYRTSPGDAGMQGYYVKGHLPYIALIEEKIKEYFTSTDTGIIPGNLDVNLIELIWNYWHEEGMVSQTIYALARRFQNIKSSPNDPLASFDLDPLRPLNNILWGYIQDAQHRLGLQRRNLTYQQLYGWSLAGVNGLEPADKRSRFQQSFHRLIFEATEYFTQSDNTTIRPDGFKLLNALSDTHRILAEGAHNQFGDLPFVARTEMLIEQWILSRPEVREFLGGKIMVPYQEPWMDRVDSMKALQGWDNTSVSFYNELAVYGEEILLSVRYGNWTAATRDMATNWADTFRDSIQKYIHSYATVTGSDLSAINIDSGNSIKYMLPATLIRQKLIREKSMLRRYN